MKPTLCKHLRSAAFFSLLGGSALAHADATSPVVAGTSADVSLSKTLDTVGPYHSGQTISYTLTVANAGPSAATNVQVSDTPFNLTITSVSGGGCAAMPCTIASLAAGANAVITVNATIAAAGSFDNIASVTANDPDPNSGNNSDTTDNGGFASASADVSTTITAAPDPVLAGASITYQITVTNAGPDQAGAIHMEFPLPPGTTFVSQSNDLGWICFTPVVGANGTISCGPAFGTLQVGAVNFTVVAAVAPGLGDGTVLSGTASATATFTSDPVPANNSATATTTVVGLPLEPSVPVPALDRYGQLLIALLMLGFAAVTLRRPAA